MGAQDFRQDGEGRTMQEAFAVAHEQALYEYGHRGYTGSLAEKPGAVEFVLPQGVTVPEAINAMMQAGFYDADPAPDWLPQRFIEAYNDKWGDAVGIRTGETSWVFVGTASS